MKKLLLLFVLLSMGLVSALPNPASVYCGEMNYTLNDSFCIFDNGESCEQWAFFNGSCGQEHVRNLSCAVAGGQRGVVRECCVGLAELENFNLIEGDCQLLVGAYATCSDCGDGICEEWENECNCLEDCEEPQQICESLCGDGACQEIVCLGEGCPCAETIETCPGDCVEVLDGDEEKGVSMWWVFVILVVLVFLIIVGLKIAKWLVWAAIIAAIIFGIWFFVF
ncbi:MAG: DUF333 domain-containing protein [Nanoarchaeota archaeon]|nr:DUF333 domain-containing protein [Nanoarchaeota archaeon]MBU1051093.1 DUF333 domain-containing protein [Nanoarchaeota archaeon]MBU1987950.1 DUF333 domain-containing protein [Nanoarchaeota archaeon]